MMVREVARIVRMLSLVLLVLGLLVTPASARPAPTNEELGACEGASGTLVWQQGGWYCETDTNQNPGGTTHDNWDNETTTTTKGNSGKTRDTQTCVYNPGGQLHKGSDPDCPNPQP